MFLGAVVEFEHTNFCKVITNLENLGNHKDESHVNIKAKVVLVTQHSPESLSHSPITEFVLADNSGKTVFSAWGTFAEAITVGNSYLFTQLKVTTWEGMSRCGF